MKRFAVVSSAGGIVENVVFGEDLETVASVVGECIEETEITGVAGIGYAWDGSVFLPPPLPSSAWNGTEWITISTQLLPPVND